MLIMLIKSLDACKNLKNKKAMHFKLNKTIKMCLRYNNQIYRQRGQMAKEPR